MPIPLPAQIVLACLLGGVLSIGAAALIMFGLPRRWITLTVSFSTGLLLAMAPRAPRQRRRRQACG